MIHGSEDGCGRVERLPVHREWFQWYQLRDGVRRVEGSTPLQGREEKRKWMGGVADWWMTSAP